MNIKDKLFLYQDLKYRDFHSSLVPNIDKDRFIGVRTPILRNLAKEMIKDGSYKEFIKDLPHYYYEENTLHSCILSLYKDLEELINELEAAGKLEDTVIVLYSDHYPYGLTNQTLNSYFDYNVGTQRNVDRTPFVIYNSVYNR